MNIASLETMKQYGPNRILAVSISRPYPATQNTQRYHGFTDANLQEHVVGWKPSMHPTKTSRDELAHNTISALEAKYGVISRIKKYKPAWAKEPAESLPFTVHVFLYNPTYNKELNRIDAEEALWSKCKILSKGLITLSNDCILV